MPAFRIAMFLFLLFAILACGSSSSETDTVIDAHPDMQTELGAQDSAFADTASDALEEIADRGGDSSEDAPLQPAGDADAAFDSLQDKVAEPNCLADPPAGQFTGLEPVIDRQQQGVDAGQLQDFHILSDAALSAANTLFVNTWLSDEDAYLIKFKGGHIKFKRIVDSSGVTYQVVEQLPGAPLACTDAAEFNSYEAELAAFENPMSTTYEELGYAVDDPRVGFIPADKHCYPHMFRRIAQLYDSPNAPDFHVSPTPYGYGSGGSHGALDVLQSRAPLVISGHGIKKQVDEVSAPLSVDIAPTVLHLMGATPAPGLKSALPHDAVYLKWQDGTPLTSMLEDGCVEAYRYAIIILFDGLQSNELVYLYESQELPLPSFTQIMSDGTIFKNGAVVGFPSVSVAGHLSIGTGMLNGHHYFIGNGFYYRDDDLLLSPGDIMSKADEYAAEPELALELFDYVMNPAGETIFEAAHRHFGDGFFCASVNELTLRGADYNLVDLARALGPRLDYYDLADTMAIPQVTDLLSKNAAAGPMLFYVSFYGTDKAGEHSGPHGQELRDKLVWLDGQMAPLLLKLEELGIADQTLIILTADHGMELQDKNQSGSWQNAMQATEIPFLDPDGFGFVYLLPI